MDRARDLEQHCAVCGKPAGNVQYGEAAYCDRHIWQAALHWLTHALEDALRENETREPRGVIQLDMRVWVEDREEIPMPAGLDSEE